PVAPKCNIKCNYCDRKYDCVNESRPGVASAILTPSQALRYLERVVEKLPNLAVVGIAGPGDPLANPAETLEILRLVRERFPDMLLCLATNGLALPDYLDDLAQIGVSHVTVTVNAVDPEIGHRIYAWVRHGKVIYRGARGAEFLLERQLESIRGLHARGIVTKVNTIVIPGINDHHVGEVARTVAAFGADLLNCMPIYPNRDTPFADVGEPSTERLAALRAEAEQHLPQMRHCTRCRADAVGLLGEDQSREWQGCLNACSREPAPVHATRPYVAVATHEGLLVNQHLGEATRFQIWGNGAGGFRLIEERLAPRPGTGAQRWLVLADILKDCRAVLVSGVGERPREILSDAGILPVEMSGFIETGLQAIFEGGQVNAFRGRRTGCAKGGGCGGDGSGC
ncbi:MAG TPA: nitrogen fixation protein NifB, partial [Syntrophobacteraceae bacterium]|nr:nitrogen fixation protein NifB [Syntrophobacteraceae bacterium]